MLAYASYYLLTHPDYFISKLLIDYLETPEMVSLIIILFSIFIVLWLMALRRAKQTAMHLKEANKKLTLESQDRLHAEQSKQKLEIALLQGQKLQAMGTLASGIAHDFNNILYAIKGYVEMAREDVKGNMIVANNLTKVLSAADRGQQLIGRILAFSRKQTQHFEIIQLNETIEAALSLLRPTIPASVLLNYTEHCIATMLADKTQIHQVLVNLINNAVDAMDDEGQIDVEFIKASKKELLQAPETNAHEKWIKIKIRDNGQGMSQSTLERMYEPFFTTKEVGKGTGLGLSIVHSIIENHHGQITVESQLGKGSCFTLLFPAQSIEERSQHGNHIIS